MMRTKRLLRISALPLGIVVIPCVLAILPPSPGVTKANFDRIQEGMTLSDVEEIFGREELDRHGREGLDDLEHYDGAVYIDWHAPDGTTATLRFRHKCVTGKDWRESNETILNKIRRWLRLA